mgnify:FL=1
MPTHGLGGRPKATVNPFKTWYVYGLEEQEEAGTGVVILYQMPDDWPAAKVKYIGVTNHPKSRVANHWMGTFLNRSLNRWINQLKREDKGLEMVLLTSTSNSEMARKEADRLIKRLGGLLNKIARPTPVIDDWADRMEAEREEMWKQRGVNEEELNRRRFLTGRNHRQIRWG